jgi:hypothetical protein
MYAHAYEVCAYKVYPREVHAYEVHARKVHAHEMHVCEVHAREVYTHKIYAFKIHAYEVHVHEVYPHGMHAHKTLTNGGAVVDLSRSELQKTSFGGSCGVVPIARCNPCRKRQGPELPGNRSSPWLPGTPNPALECNMKQPRDAVTRN